LLRRYVKGLRSSIQPLDNVDTLTIVADVASLVGLGVSVLTLFVARSAQAAAREARDAVRLTSANDEFRALARMTGECLSYAENKQIEAAAVRARDVLTGMTAARQRWKTFISAEGLQRLDEMTAQVVVVSQSLGVSRNGEPLNLKKLLKVGNEVLTVLSDEAGKLSSRIDE
jgi:hypothetical protein